ncbi:MAG: hypothetical protein KJ792_07115 [Actinobacteria bacterium]|nr:hypothetical protein [Actinomycetota bacterium]MCG2801677.1 hypothetical protein [Cellulomonas sp.]
MNVVLALAPRLRSAGGQDSRVITLLAVTAFTVSTALTLSVVGGLIAFQQRAAHPVGDLQHDSGGFYVILAATALVLLVVPLLTLAGAAARLGVVRRDARLSTLRLLGATPAEVVMLTVVETAWQGLVGALAGVGLYVVLLPLWAMVPFQGTTFTPEELWIGAWALLAAVVVPLLAATSAAISMRRVVVTPLGVARRQGDRALSWVRLGALVLGAGAFAVGTQVMGMFGSLAVLVMLGLLALGFGAINLVGPWVLGLIGRASARRARNPAQLLAARRLASDPKGAWRVVGGLGLAGFVAGVLAMLPVLTASSGEQDEESRIILQDLVTGGMLTLGIAFLLAAVSAGIAQAAAVLDRRREFALARLAGFPVELFDEVRRREVLLPLLVVGAGSAATALLMLLPLFGTAALEAPQGLLLLIGSLTGGVLLVLGATETSRPLLRSVLADPVVRAD